MKTVLLTGGYGFLGSHLLKALIEDNYNVIVLEKSFASDWRIKKLHLKNKFKFYLEDKCNLEDIFKNNQIDLVIHTATDYGRELKQYELINNNVIFPLKILELLKTYKGEAFFNTDSYFNKPNTCMSYLGNYIMTKKHLENWLKLEKEVKVFNMKLEHIYGELDSDQKFVTSIYNQLKANVKSIDLTEGSQKRDFINVREVVEIYIKLLKSLRNLKDGFYNLEIGTGKSISVKEFVEDLKKRLNSTTKLNFGALEMRENEIMDSKAELENLKKIIMKNLLEK